jgi:molybdenum cofactor cytidylyltransferase
MNGPALPTLRVLILAAGFSRRLGQPKALARVHGVSLIRRLVLLLAPFAAARPILVVPPRSARYKVELRGIDADFAVNPRRADGMSSSVRRGIARVRFASAVLVVPVDLRSLRRRDVARLVHRWRGARRRVAVSRLGTHLGAPLILPRWLFMPALRIEGDVGLRELVRRLPAEHLMSVSMRSAQDDIDTALDLRVARRRFTLSDLKF